jgi:hypothetical protein
MRLDPVAREARTMTRAEVIQKAIEKRITWQQAAAICRVAPRHMLRLRRRYELFEVEGLRDRRTGKRQPTRIPAKTVDKLCRLKKEIYADFSVRHFHQFATEKHGLKISYTWARIVLQAKGLVEKAASRGKYRRKRERRPMVGMLVHQDASTHEWVPGLPMADLVITLDDADGRILQGRFVEQEGTMSSLQGLHHVLRRYGRFCEFYTDRGSHYCRTDDAEEGPALNQDGQVSRVLKALGIRHILARSPEARGRSERAFGTIQGRLPQELRLAGIKSYAGANDYLREHFIPDFNRRFVVRPTQPEIAFIPLVGLSLDLLVSVHHDRVVQKDNTVVFGRLFLQLPPSKERVRYFRCPVIVHELVDGHLAISFHGKLLARFDRQGAPLPVSARIGTAA